MHVVEQAIGLAGEPAMGFRCEFGDRFIMTAAGGERATPSLGADCGAVDLAFFPSVRYLRHEARPNFGIGFKQACAF